MQSPLDPKDTLVFLTNRIGRQLSNLILAEMDDIDGYRPQGTHMAILADLYEEKTAVRQQDLAVSAIKDKGTIARSLNQLEEAGMVVRTTDVDDRRNKLISMTPKGLEVVSRFRPAKATIMDIATQDVSIEDLNHCKKTLALIFNNLQAHINQPQHD